MTNKKSWLEQNPFGMIQENSLVGESGISGIYPLVNVYIANWKDPPIFKNGKSPINGPCSIAMLNYQRVCLDHIGPKHEKNNVFG